MQADQLNVLSFFFFSVLVLNLAAASAGFMRLWAQPLYRDVIAVTLIWSIYNIFLVVLALGALWEKRQSRQHHRLIVAGQAMLQFPRVRQRRAVDLVDLSLSGLSFNSQLDFEVKDRERVIVEAASADGLICYFEAEVVRSSQPGERTICGARFLVPAQSLPDVVHYVYGDSDRWSLVWEARSRGVALTRVIGQLIKMGLRGAWICLTIVLRIAWDWIRATINSRQRRAEAKA
jgi:cellulose synthase (UDP-forming)